MFEHTPDFKCAPPRRAMARSIPTVYAREEYFTTRNLVGIAAALAIGWVLGHAVREDVALSLVFLGIFGLIAKVFFRRAGAA